jgi:hypothetical protein
MLRTVVTDDDTCSLLWQKPVNLPSPQQKQRRAQSSTGIQTTVDLHADSEAATHFLRGKDGGGWTKSLGPAYGLTRNHREMIAWRETDTPTRRGGRLELYLAFVASLPAFVALVPVGKRRGS